MIGLVEGGAVVSPGISKGLAAAFSAFNEGQIKEYEDILRQSRALARKEMVKKAVAQGADAIVSMRYATSEVAQGVSEVVAYGTAVKLLKPGATL